MVAADEQLPSLRLVLDDAALAQRAGMPARRTYLRYKPGTSVVAAVALGGRATIVYGWGGAAPQKRAKTLRRVHPGDVLLDDPALGLLVVDAMADRHLPTLRRVRRPDWLEQVATAALGPQARPLGLPRTLAHKPGRRWVGSLETVGDDPLVLRAYTRGSVRPALAAHQRAHRAAGARVRLPRVRHADLGRGLLVLDHLPGQVIPAHASDRQLTLIGRAASLLHARGPSRLVAGTARAPEPATLPGPLLPEITELARRTASLAREGVSPAPSCLIHGDLSRDQVIDDEPPTVIDLDRSRWGVPSEDLASVLAVEVVEALAAADPTAPATDARTAPPLTEVGLEVLRRSTPPLLDGYGSQPQDLQPYLALALLARAAEPFRQAHPRWPAVMTAIVETAAVVVGAPGCGSAGGDSRAR